METIYLEREGRSNTDRVLETVFQFVKKTKITHVVVASTTGETGVKATKVFRKPNYNLVVVTHHAGFRDPGELELDQDARKIIEGDASALLITSHALSGLERSFRKGLRTYLPVEMLAMTLRRCFGEGTKVCMEMALMAADSGLVPVSEDIVCIGGTGRGADVAWVVRASHTNALFDLKMRRAIIRPIDWQ